MVFEASGVDEAAEPLGVQAQKGRQLRAGEGGLRHVEVFQLPCMTVSIVGRPRPIPIATMHHPHPPPILSIGPTYYALKHEEPNLLG